MIDSSESIPEEKEEVVFKSSQPFFQKLEQNLMSYKTSNFCNESQGRGFRITSSNIIFGDNVDERVIDYTIHITEETTIIITRKHRDFQKLRQKLIDRWPGTFIPSIPNSNHKPRHPNNPAKDEKHWLEYKMKMLNKFCHKVSNDPILYNSEEVKIFLSDNENTFSILDKLSYQTIDEIKVKYKQVYQQIFKDETLDLKEIKKKINDFEAFVNKTYRNLCNFREITATNLDKKYQEMQAYDYMMTIISDYEKYALLQYCDNDDSNLMLYNTHNIHVQEKILLLQEHIINPFINLLDWQDEELSELEAYAESLSSLNGLFQQKQEQVEEKDALDGRIKEISSDDIFYRIRYYFAFKFLFPSKSKENQISDCEISKNIIDDNIAQLNIILRLASCAILEKINCFKQEHLAGYYQSLKLVAEVNKVNSSHLSGIWKKILSEKKRKEYEKERRDKVSSLPKNEYKEVKAKDKRSTENRRSDRLSSVDDETYFGENFRMEGNKYKENYS